MNEQPHLTVHDLLAMPENKRKTVIETAFALAANEEFEMFDDYGEDEMPEECFGLPYTMHIRDIEKLTEFSDLREVDKHRKEDGWVLLSIKQYADTDTYVHSGDAIYNSHPVYIMGIPRPQYCVTCKGKKTWNHAEDEWQCPRVAIGACRWR